MPGMFVRGPSETRVGEEAKAAVAAFETDAAVTLSKEGPAEAVPEKRREVPRFSARLALSSALAARLTLALAAAKASAVTPSAAPLRAATMEETTSLSPPAAHEPYTPRRPVSE